MPLSRRQRNAFGFFTDDHRFAFDVESPVEDLSDVSFSPTPVQSFLSALPTPPRNSRGSSPYLRHAWLQQQQQQQQQQQRNFQASTLPDGEAVASPSGPPPASPKPMLMADSEGPAPIYAFTSSHQQQQRQELRRQKRSQQRRQLLSQCGESGDGSSGTCVGRNYWVRFKVIGYIVAGVLALDLYFAWWGGATEEASMNEELFPSTTAKLLMPHLDDRHAASGVVFPELSSTNHDRGFLQGGHLGYWRRSSATRGTDVRSGGLFDEIGDRKADMEQVSSHRSKSSGGAITPHTRQSLLEFRKEGDRQRHASVDAVVGETAADDDAATRHEHIPIPGMTPQEHHADQSLTRPDRFDGQRVAVVVPYVGGDLPAWWDVFAEQAELNVGLVDWIIFCDQKLVRKKSPSNVKFFPMSTRRMAWLLSAVVEENDPKHVDRGSAGGSQLGGDSGGDSGGGGGGGSGGGSGGGVGIVGGDDRAAQGNQARSSDRSNSEGSAADILGGGTSTTGDDDRATANPDPGATAATALAKTLATRRRAALFLHQLLITSPYFIVEFKPALGWLFREYLTEYTHWAFGDLDVVFGDMRNGWLEPFELHSFDIITFSFGDQYRAYLRGQLTIHKNRPDVNRVWRRCRHLTNYSERIETYSSSHRLSLESAEGCYSLAAASGSSLKIKFTVKALSDVDREHEDEQADDSTSQTEVIVDGNGLVTLCPDLSFYDGPPSIGGAATANVAADPASFGDGDHGDQGSNEAWSVVPSMQDAVGPVTTVERANTSELRCEHWIRPEHQTCVLNVEASHNLFFVDGEYYKQEFINTAAATGGRDCRAGAFYHFQKHKRSYRTWNSRPPVHPAHFGISAGPGGIVPLPAAGWRERVSGPGFQPPKDHSERVRRYCLGWIERRRSVTPEGGRPEQACAVKVTSEDVVFLADTRQTQNLGRGEGGTREKTQSATSVTLGSVGAPGELEAFMSNTAGWEGPKIFATVLDDDDLAAAQQSIDIQILQGAEYSSDYEHPDAKAGILVVAFLRPPVSPNTPRMVAAFPQKSLMNLVTDLCDSRYLFHLPRASRLGPNAFQAVSARLRSNRGPPDSSQESDEDAPVGWQQSSRGATVGVDSVVGEPPAPLPPRPSEDIPGGPVTLVVPFRTPDEELSVQPGRASVLASADSVRGRVHGRQKLEERTVDSSEAVQRPSTASDAPADADADAARGLPIFPAIPLKITFHPPVYGGTKVRMANNPDAVGAGVGGDARGSVAATAMGTRLTPASSSQNDGQRRRGHAVDTQGGPKMDTSLHQPVLSRQDLSQRPERRRLQEGSKRLRQGPSRRKESERQRGEQRRQPPEHPSGIPMSKGIDWGAIRRLAIGDGKARTTNTSSDLRTKRRRPDSFGEEAADADGVRAAGSAWGSSGDKERAGGAAGGTSEWIDEETEWVRSLLFQGVPGASAIPGLVVDLWSPGPLFLRHVEEFGDCGCMDAAYALGLWRAGSSFQVVEGATLESSASTTFSLETEASRKRETAVASGLGSAPELRVPGGECLSSEAVADTASIYSSFLNQVANVYQRSWSGKAGAQPYQDHWDHIAADA